MAAADLETRTVVLETKVSYIEDKLADQVEKLDELCDGIASVREHIAKQNGALPRIEANTALAASRINQLETLIYEHTKSENLQVLKNAQEVTRLSEKHLALTTRQKMIWGGIAAVIGSAFTVGVKYLIPLIISLF